MPFDAAPEGEQWLHEIKFDCYRVPFQREIVDRAVLSLKDAGVPFLFDRVKKLA